MFLLLGWIAVWLLLASCGGGSTKHSSAVLTRSTALLERQRLGAEAGCSTAVASAPALPGVRTAFVRVSGPPFGVATTPDGRWSFVDELVGHVAVFSDGGFAPRLVRMIDLPQGAQGNSLTRDGRYLLVANGADGATVVSVARAESGAHSAVLGTLTEGRHAGGRGGAIEVISSPDGRYVFVSVEHGDAVAVYNLRTALTSRFRSSSYLGSIPLGRAVVGMAVSPDSRWLYVTSEVAAGARPATRAQGTLSVINLAEAEHHPARSVLATVPAHCSPVRVAVSADGSTVWVTARESDQLLAFSAAKLISDPGHALLAAVRVGDAPIALALIAGGRQVVVADSNGIVGLRKHSDLTLVNAAAALAGGRAILGTIPTGSFPREMALEPNTHMLLVGDYGSNQLEAVDVADLRPQRISGAQRRG